MASRKGAYLHPFFANGFIELGHLGLDISNDVGCVKRKTGVFLGRGEKAQTREYGDSGLDEPESRMTAQENG